MKKITKSVISLFAVALLTLIVACTQSANEFTVKFLVDFNQPFKSEFEEGDL